MRTTRVIIGLVAAAALAVSGCGTTETARDGAVETSTGGPVTVVDSRGKSVRLDHPAKRVAATEWNGVEDLVSLGVQPAGVADIKGYEQWVSAAPLDGTAKDIGTRGEPSLDTIGSLNLDLVVVTDGLTGDALKQLEAKVPVIVIKGGDAKDPVGSMFTALDTIAKATGTEAAAARLKRSFDAKVAKGKAEVRRLGADGEKVAFSDSYVDSGSVHIRPFTKGSLVADVFARIGLESPWTVKGDPVYGLGAADVEGLTKLPDVRFWYEANSTEGDPFTEELADNAIWTSLPFVKGKKVHRLPDSLWMFGGPTSMEQYVDAAVDALKA